MEDSESLIVTGRETRAIDSFRNIEAHASGVSWPAVIAGAFVTAALWLILLALGTGIGLSAISPWSNTGAAAATVGRIGIIWLIIVQIIASGMGGYLAGRLRTKWATIHTDEVYFRDTAHGFLVWAVGLVISAAFLASAATSLADGAGQSGRMAFSTVNAAATTSALPAGGLNLNTNDYYIDRLFRTNHPGSEAKGLLGNNLSRWSHAGMEVRLSAAAATKRRDRSSSNLLRAQKRCLIAPRSATSLVGCVN